MTKGVTLTKELISDLPADNNVVSTANPTCYDGPKVKVHVTQNLRVQRDIVLLRYETSGKTSYLPPPWPMSPNSRSRALLGTAVTTHF